MDDMKDNRIRSLMLAAGDLVIFYGVLALVVFVRYGAANFYQNWTIHQFPFSIVFVLWIILFFIAGFYEVEMIAENQLMRERVIRTMFVAAALAITLFYIIPAFGITPKTNLVIHVLLTTLFLLLWRAMHGTILARRSKIRGLFFSTSPEVATFVEYLKSKPHLGYEPISIMTLEESEYQTPTSISTYTLDHTLPDMIRSQKINLVVASHDIHRQKNFAKMLYDILPLGITFIDFPTFYERITGKIPVSFVSEVWFLENLAKTERRVFEITKRIFDITVSLFLGALTVILLPFITLFIKLESRGPIFFKQKRVGKNGKTFELIKFRSMIDNAEKGQAVWAKEDDHRVTKVGNFLRKTRLDELPQIWNVVKGDMSLIGLQPKRHKGI